MTQPQTETTYNYDEMINVVTLVLNLPWSNGYEEFHAELYSDHDFDDNYVEEKYDEFSKDMRRFWNGSDPARKKQLVEWATRPRRNNEQCRTQ